MAHTLYFLTATWLAAQGVEPPLANPQAASNYPSSCNCQQGGMGGTRQQMSNGSRGMPAQERPGLWGRIRNLFQRQPQQNQQYYGQHGQPNQQRMQMVDPRLLTSGEPPLAEPNLGIVTNVQTVAIANAPQPATQSAATPLNFKLVNKIGHEDDYTWVTGQLFQEGGYWIVRYATPETVDRFQGALILAGEKALDQFRAGDLVSVRGTVVQNPRGGLALYRVTTVDLIERNGQ